MLKNGKKLELRNLSHPKIKAKVVSLDPPPFKLDKRIANLKRIDIVIPAEKCHDKTTQIKIRLRSNSSK